jgi:hypothetical protein
VVTNDAKQWLASMENSIKIGRFLPTDYNPPAYHYASNVSTESKNQHTKSESFKITLSAQLSALSTGIYIDLYIYIYI